MRDYIHTDSIGIHWPDTPKGSDNYFTIDLSTWLENEVDTLVSNSWELPSEVTSSDDYISNNQAHIKLNTGTVGIFKITLTLVTTDTSREQTTKVPMILRVY